MRTRLAASAYARKLREDADAIERGEVISHNAVWHLHDGLGRVSVTTQDGKVVAFPFDTSDCEEDTDREPVRVGEEPAEHKEDRVLEGDK